MIEKRRKEIDALRAIAIISVILFHFKRDIFPLGFLGVDLFFIISGYVISLSIKNRIDQKVFTFISFYVRRIKRILPVVLFVLLFISIFSVFILLANDLQRYAQSLLSTLGFFANIYFWISGGYFGINDELKPLLHMWSLSVEEQFYLIFPLFLFLVIKFFKNKTLKLLIIFSIVIISYFLNIYFLNRGNSDPAFFLLPTRVWQFGLGALIVFLPLINFKNNFLNNTFTLLAFTFIVINFFIPIPVIPKATLMSIGAIMILSFKWSENLLVFKLLKIKLVQFIGLISFSLYLWHWPIYTLTKYILIDEVSNYLIIGGILLTFLLSFLSWKYIEQPFQKKYSTKKVLQFVAASYLFLILFSTSIYLKNGFPERHDQYANSLASAVGSNFHCSIDSFRAFGASHACIANDEKTDDFKIVLLGNSHAQMYGWSYIDSLKKFKKKGMIVPLNSCLPLIDSNVSLECLNLANANFEAIKNDKMINKVIIAFTWYSKNLIDEKGNKVQDGSFKKRNDSLINLIDKIEATGKSVYLIGPIDRPKYNFASSASRIIAFNHDENIKIKSLREEFDKEYGQSISLFSSKLQNKFLLPHKILCDDKFCYFGDNKGSFYADGNHLSFYGSKKMQSLFDNIVK